MMPQDDPAIAQIRETRHRISERCGHDPQKLVDYYIELQKKYQDRLLDETGMRGTQAAKGAKSITPVSVLRDGAPIYALQEDGLDEEDSVEIVSPHEL
jgi:hypothetical protein